MKIIRINYNIFFAIKLQNLSATFIHFYFGIDTALPATITGAVGSLNDYDWLSDGRAIQISAEAGKGGTVSGGGILFRNESLILTAAPDEGYTFDGWYEKYNDAEKACDTAEFEVKVENVTANTIYIARFTKNTVYYTVTAKADEGGTVSGGGEIEEGGSITLIASANEGYTFEGWYEGEIKVCDTAEFTVENVTADKSYTAKFKKDETENNFDFTSIRTARANSIIVDHENKTISMSSDSNVKNIVIYHDQLDIIPGGTIKLSDAMGTNIQQNSGSFYIINNAGIAEVLVDITIGDVTQKYSIKVNFSAFVGENLRMYQRRVGSTQNDIVYGTDVGYVSGNEIYITPDAGIEYIGITKYQGKPGNYNGIITPVESYPTYSTFEESTSAGDYIFVDWQNCIFVRKPENGQTVQFDVNYELNGETSVYTVIVDFSMYADQGFDFETVRAGRAKNIVVDHNTRTIDMESDGKVVNVAVYQYQLNENGCQIKLADAMDAVVMQNISSFYIMDDGSGTSTVLVDVIIGSETRQYTLTVRFADGFDFTTIRSLRGKNTVVDHEARTIEMTSDGKVSNVAIYKSQLDIIPGGTITLADAKDADVTQNEGSFYIADDGSGKAEVVVDITIGSITKQYTLIVNFSDGFDFDGIRTLRAADIFVDHSAQKIMITAESGAENVALYMAQTGVINSGKLVMKDEMDSIVQTNSGSYYVIKNGENNTSSVTVDMTIGEKTKTYEITVSFSDEL